MKSSGGGAAKKRADRRQAKFNPGVGPHSVKPVGGGDALTAPEPAEKRKKALGKLSKKRKAEGGGGGDAPKKSKGDKLAKRKSGGGDSTASGAGGAPSKKHSDAPKHVAATRKEQKEWSNEQKALQKPNFTLIQEIVGLWERLRVKKLSAADKRALVVSIFKACKGKVADLANNHKGSRVIQALLKYGTPEERDSVYAECTPQIAPLAKSLYGHFLVKKLVDATPKEKLPELLRHVKGSVRSLAKHPVASQVLESLYFPAPPKEKLAMRVEFYGSEFALFGASGDGGAGAGAVTSLRDAMLRKPIAQRQGMLRQMNAALLPILEKGLVSPSLVHKVLAEYLEIGGPGTKHEAAQSLAAPAFLRMVHTREGAHAVNMMYAHAGAKQRKAVLKALKGNVGRVVRDEHAASAVAFALDATDDTQLAAKIIIAELRNEGLAELAEDRAARRVLLHALRPRHTRYVHPQVLATIPDVAEVMRDAEEARRALSRGQQPAPGDDDDDAEEAEADAEEDDEMMDDEFEEEEEAEEEEQPPQMTKRRSRAAEAGGDDDDDDDDDAGGGDGMDFGVPRKDPAQRRREIFSAPGNLGRSLVAACVGSAASMLRSATASDVLFETCAGGADDVVVGAVGADQMKELHEAVAEAVRASVAGEEKDEDDDDEDEDEDKDGKVAGSKPGLPLHEDYFSTRTLRRAALEITGDRDGSAPNFAATLWESAVAHDVDAWVGGHGAKVVAAIMRAGDEETRKACAAALKKSNATKGKSPEEWAAGFFRERDEGKKKTVATEKRVKRKAEEKASEKTPGKKKAAAAAAAAAAASSGEKTPGKGLSVKTKTPAAKGKASAEGGKSPKSPKETKFSPRLTRAQRAAKEAKAAGKK